MKYFGSLRKEVFADYLNGLGWGSVAELREVMGVPGGRYANFADIRLRVIEPAIVAVNQIADFVASYRVENGPRNKVVAVELLFLPKDPAGRAGTVETLRPLTLP